MSDVGEIKIESSASENDVKIAEIEAEKCIAEKAIEAESDIVCKEIDAEIEKENRDSEKEIAETINEKIDEEKEDDIQWLKQNLASTREAVMTEIENLKAQLSALSIPPQQEMAETLITEVPETTPETAKEVEKSAEVGQKEVKTAERNRRRILKI